MQNGRGYNRNGGGRAVRRDTPVKRTAAPNVHKRPSKQGGHGIRFLNNIKISTGNVDYMFLGVVIVLITFGLVMLFSASSGTAYSDIRKRILFCHSPSGVDGNRRCSYDDTFKDRLSQL